MHPPVAGRLSFRAVNAERWMYGVVILKCRNTILALACVPSSVANNTYIGDRDGRWLVCIGVRYHTESNYYCATGRTLCGSPSIWNAKPEAFLIDGGRPRSLPKRGVVRRNDGRLQFPPQGHSRQCGERRSVPSANFCSAVVLELQRNLQWISFQVGDHRLEVVFLGAGDSQHFPLDAGVYLQL